MSWGLSDNGSTWYYVVFEVVFPVCGVILSSTFALSPLPLVMQLRIRGKGLGGYDPIPPTINVGNGVAWMMYSLAVKNYYQFASGSVALIGSSAIFLMAYPLADHRFQRLLGGIMFGSSMLLFIGSLLVLVLANSSFTEKFTGVTADVLVLLLYASPLFNMVTIIKTHDSSSIYLPWSLLQLLNGLLWTLYSAAIGDSYIFASSAFGVITALAAIALRMIYPSSKRRTRTLSKDGGGSALEFTDVAVHELEFFIALLFSYLRLTPSPFEDPLRDPDTHSQQPLLASSGAEEATAHT